MYDKIRSTVYTVTTLACSAAAAAGAHEYTKDKNKAIDAASMTFGAFAGASAGKEVAKTVVAGMDKVANKFRK